MFEHFLLEILGLIEEDKGQYPPLVDWGDIPHKKAFLKETNLVKKRYG